jgi:hypothetical protein
MTMELDDDVYVLQFKPIKDYEGNMTGEFDISCLTSKDNPHDDETKFNMIMLMRLTAEAVSVIEEDQDFEDYLASRIDEDEEDKAYTDNVITLFTPTKGSA